MNRRELIAGLGGVAAWPLAARAQQPKLPVIVLMGSATASANEQRLTTFREGLKATGFVEHQNVNVEYRWAAGDYDRLHAFANEFV